ncbi:MAG TPA: transporter substrate-binding domain-containing protein [Nitrospirae bacterium]|nr:putative aliphatic sulfonates-binding protein precursor [bacterium BMS3Abin10]GBE39587.1 putative aliphatic sulfonates-binding protein precursor [bacterium BMS3Bbin08]HDH00551.1 transporter substrate-binding domain-containing protein [Nitrospirota bacterium]
MTEKTFSTENSVRRKFFLWITGMIAVAVLLIGGCERFGGQKPGKQIDKVTLGVSATSLLPSMVHIAKAKGYFLEQGIDMEIMGYPTGKHALAAVLKKEVNIGTVADTPIVFNSFVRDDFSAFATIVDSARHAKALARKDRNIETPQDLTGKKIATTRGTTAHFFMDVFFVFNGMDPSAIEVYDLKPKEMVRAIVNGDVDSIFAWEPNISKAQNILGDNAVFLPANVGYMATFNLVSKNDFIENNPELIKRVLRALSKAEKFIKENRDESVDIIAQHLNADHGKINTLWDMYEFRLSLSQSLLITMEDEARWAIKNNLTDKTEVPNYLDFIYIDALEEVRPEAVSIIH